MKVHHLVEDSNDQQKRTEAEKKLRELFADIADGIEDMLDGVEFDEIKSDRYVKFKNIGPDYEHLELSGSVTDIHNWNLADNKVSPVAEASLVLDIPHKHPGLLDSLRKKINSIFKHNNLHLAWSNGSPWHFDNSSRVTAKFDVMKFPDEAREKPADSGRRYDPRAEFMTRPGEMARQRRVAQSAYRDSFGGDSSNYRR